MTLRTLTDAAVKSAALGLVLGIISWFVRAHVSDLLVKIFPANTSLGSAGPLIALAMWGAIWCGSALVVILKIWRNQSTSLFCGMLVSMCWFVAMIGYYGWYCGELLLGLGGPQLRVRVGNGWAAWRQDVRNLQPVLEHIREDFIFWSLMAIVLGLLVGFFGAQYTRMEGPNTR